MTIIPLTIGLSVTGKNWFRQTGYRFRKINGFNIPMQNRLNTSTLDAKNKHVGAINNGSIERNEFLTDTTALPSTLFYLTSDYKPHSILGVYY